MKDIIFFETERKKYNLMEVLQNIYKQSLFSVDTFRDNFIRYIHYYDDFFNDIMMSIPTPLTRVDGRDCEISFGILLYNLDKTIPIDDQTRLKSDIIWNRKRKSLYYYPLITDNSIINDKPILSGYFDCKSPTIYNIYSREDNKLSLMTTGSFIEGEANYSAMFRPYLEKNYTEQLRENIIKTIKL